MKNYFVIIIVIILFVAAVSAVIFYTQSKQIIAELSSLEKRIEVVKGQIIQTKGNIDVLEKQNKQIKEQIAKAENQISSYNNQLIALKSEKEILVGELQNKRMQLVSLKDELGALVRKKEELESKAEQLMSKQQSIKEDIVSFREAKRQLEESIKKHMGHKEGVELEKIVVKLSEVPDGSILEVNDKYGFAIINIGSKDGIIVGDIFDVYRNNILVGMVVVDKVFEEMSSVVPTEGFSDVELAVADKVSLAR